MDKKKRATKQVPCYCRKCNGALRNKRTEQRHRSKNHIPVPDFLDWQVSRGEGPSVPRAEKETQHEPSESESDTTESSSNSNRAERPLKQVCTGISELSEFVADDIRGSDAARQSDEVNFQLSNEVDMEFDDPQAAQPEHHEDENLVCHGNEQFGSEDEDAPANGSVYTNPDSDGEEIEAIATAIQTRASLLERLDVAPMPLQSDDLEESGHAATAVPPISRIENVAISQKLIHEIQSATLDKDKLDADMLERLRNPPTEPVDISHPDTRLSLDLFMACSNASESTYTAVRDSVMRRFPDVGMLSYYSSKKLISNISGVDSIVDDMCINSCMAFVGPWAELQACPECSEPRYDIEKLAHSGKEVPRQQACTIPLGPQLQALRRTHKGATALLYRDRKLKETIENFASLPVGDRIYDDIFCGSDFRQFAEKVGLTQNDITVSFSLDGAQLYQNKKSDTWIAIWMVNDYDPTTRYKLKHVLPAIVIPGPNKPKNLDSFLFRSFYHLSALQRENDGTGIRMWDAAQEAIVLSRIAFIFGTADALGLTELDGRVGHHGALGCRMGCDMKGRHKPRSGHYCAAHLCPNDYSVEDCKHPDYDFQKKPTGPSPEIYTANLTKVVTSLDQGDYEYNRKITGIGKPSILSGLHPGLLLSIPKCFTVDLMHMMHLLFLNLGDLLISLWRGQLRCDPTDSKENWDWAVLKDDVWTTHGRLVAEATPYFPSSFHRPPRNPAEKISSGYKATEFNLYIFGLGPAFFRTVLPKKYWKNFCKLVHGVRIIIQRSITGHQIREAHSYLTQFVEEFEHIYYQRRVDRLHFCRPSLHTLLHTAPECSRTGPGTYVSQFRMERAIGDFGRDIRQPSNIFGNLCQIALRRAQINALKTMCPELDPDSRSTLPKHSYECGSNFVLLQPRDRYRTKLTGETLNIIDDKFDISRVRRWGRLRLPNGQVARSLFSESGRANTRVSRNVKIKLGNGNRFAEVQFYFLIEGHNENLSAHALVSVYDPPDQDLLEDSYHVLHAFSRHNSILQVIDIPSIISVVSLQPLPKVTNGEEDRLFVVEKSGMDDTELTGYVDRLDEVREGNRSES